MSASARLATAWDPVEELWLRWPEGLDPNPLGRERECIASLCAALTDFDDPPPQEVRMRVLVQSEASMQSAKVVLGAFRPTLQRVDPCPAFDGREAVFFWKAARRVSAVIGSLMPAELFAVLEKVSRRAGLRLSPASISFERASIETDGEGTALLTRAHWMRPGWNANLNIEQLEELLAEDFGITRCVWLDRGMDLPGRPNLVSGVARFAAPGRVLCLESNAPNDPFAGVYRAVRRTLEVSRDARGRPLEILPIPAPAGAADPAGEAIAASPLDYLQVNGQVVVPVFSDRLPAGLREAFAAAFPEAHVSLLPVPRELAARGSFYGMALAMPA